MPNNRPHASSDFVKLVPNPHSLDTIYNIQIRSHYGFGWFPNFLWLIA
jgi:hypothetical protein